jgi:hypothetical protein
MVSQYQSPGQMHGEVELPQSIDSDAARVAIPLQKEEHACAYLDFTHVSP